MDDIDGMYMVNGIISYENGELDDNQTLRLFNGLIDGGTPWMLRGDYGYTAGTLTKAVNIISNLNCC